MFLWPKPQLDTLKPNHVSLFLKKTKRKKENQGPVILYQQRLKNQFFSGLRARARRILSPHRDSNKHFCHPPEVARFFFFFEKGALGSPLENQVIGEHTV